jgi:SAM-dependent methyltransferase
MIVSKAKFSYLQRMMRHRIERQRRACPYCGESTRLELLGRKKLVVEVIRCNACLMIFRYPLDTERDNFKHYQSEYQSIEVTELPSEAELARIKAQGFRGSIDFSRKLDAVQALKSTGRALDFGCSWGYGVRQLADRGYDAIGFEVSKPRASFGRSRLAVEILDDTAALDALPGASFDLIFTNHVLEHLPNLGASLTLINRLLARDGLLFAVIPNFTGAAARNGAFWSWIGQDHPIAPTREFLGRALAEHKFGEVVFGSSPFDEVLAVKLREHDFSSLQTEGEELMVIARQARQNQR